MLRECIKATPPAIDTVLRSLIIAFFNSFLPITIGVDAVVKDSLLLPSEGNSWIKD